jgi:hypothetical protein
MIDRAARDAFADLLSRFAAGEITNMAFEQALPVSKDPAIFEIYRWGVWFLYDDVEEYALTDGAALSGPVRAIVDRWLLFLSTDLEYEWPEPTEIIWKTKLLRRLGIKVAAGPSLFSPTAQVVWPFISQGQLDMVRGDTAASASQLCNEQ